MTKLFPALLQEAGLAAEESGCIKFEATLAIILRMKDHRAQGSPKRFWRAFRKFFAEHVGLSSEEAEARDLSLPQLVNTAVDRIRTDIFQALARDLGLNGDQEWKSTEQLADAWVETQLEVHKKEIAEEVRPTVERMRREVRQELAKSCGMALAGADPWVDICTLETHLRTRVLKAIARELNVEWPTVSIGPNAGVLAKAFMDATTERLLHKERRRIYHVISGLDHNQDRPEDAEILAAVERRSAVEKNRLKDQVLQEVAVELGIKGASVTDLARRLEGYQRGLREARDSTTPVLDKKAYEQTLEAEKLKARRQGYVEGLGEAANTLNQLHSERKSDIAHCERDEARLDRKVEPIS